MMEYGYVIKINDDSYVVHVDPEQAGSGYAVVPKVLDIQNKYDINDVRIYYEKNPQYRIDESHLLVNVSSEENLSAQELEVKFRSERDLLLETNVDSMNPMRWELLSEEKKQEWRDYRQALLDIPQQEGFPNEIFWPEVPT
jgi:hypothetical protein